MTLARAASPLRCHWPTAAAGPDFGNLAAREAEGFGKHQKVWGKLGSPGTLLTLVSPINRSFNCCPTLFDAPLFTADNGGEKARLLN
jgi:hypothetical protein